jgi:hypothetical protein
MRWFRFKARLMYPIPPAPRTAVLSTAFSSRGTIRAFDNLAAVPAFAPQAMAGTLPLIESLIGSVELTHALIVFRDELDPRLTDAERDRLWLAFHVPVFEQIIAADGTLLAAECEAHDGLHIVSPLLDLANHTIDASLCACGQSGARVISPADFKTRTATAG